jgi:hypothetical protein
MMGKARDRTRRWGKAKGEDQEGVGQSKGRGPGGGGARVRTSGRIHRSLTGG